ncbi:anti-sigma factor [Arthrobacter sp. GMC3]|uniref:anti-sigma factor family protein n=1 Tax=Arthrobacter sp. GMC3 TaxID=2058894 RepID=UPI000CE3CB5D|nr:zf-HC2 domain-containing protein [Arthrobacter sp. GMC3]
MNVPISPQTACFYAQWDAAYVLGALPPAERRDYEDHMPTCAQCRANVALLAGMPGLLAAAGPEVMEPTPEPVAVPVYAVFAMKVRRRRVRRASLAAAAVFAVVVGTGAIAVNLGSAGRVGIASEPTTTAPAPAHATAALHFLPPASGASAASPMQATGVLLQQPWGTQLEWTCTYASSQTSGSYASGRAAYEIVLVSRTGTESVVGSWEAQPGDIVSPVAASSLPLADIAQVIIRTAGSGQPLLLATP